MNRIMRAQRLTMMGFICSALGLTLAGCGGGGSSSPAASTGSSVSGVVLDGPIQGATVCLDLNANKRCDAGEPASAPTDAQGNYTITGLTTEQRNAGAEWIASVPVGASDGGTPVTAAFVLRAPANKPGVISPFSHMVQVAMDQHPGDQAAAEALVAKQLGLADANSLYANYSSGSPTADSATLVGMAPVIVGALQSGSQPSISVTPLQPNPTRYAVRKLIYTDSGNYTLRVFYGGPVTTDNLGTFYDVRSGMSAGVALANSALYPTTKFLGTTGWVVIDPTVASHYAGGNPSAGSYGPYRQLTFSAVRSLEGQPLAVGVDMANDLTKNGEATLIGVPSALTGTYPAGAEVRTQTVIDTYTPVAYNPSIASVTQDYPARNITTVDALIAAFPATGDAGRSNTVSAGNLHSSSDYSCPAGQASCVFENERLHVMFGSGNVAQFALCQLNWPANTTGTTCVPIGSGNYQKTVGIDGKTNLVTFSNLPAAASGRTYTRVFVEDGGQVRYVYQDVPTTKTYTRLNDTAFTPIAAQLGITVPANPN